MAPVPALSAEDYVSDTAFARERDAIFARNWLLAGLARDLPGPGHWRADCINGWPILLVRDAEGVLRAFHNVCRHRGAALEPGDGGQGRLLVCPYHAWSYRLDGGLNKAPRFADAGSFDPADFALLPLRVEAWGGLVFVCLDAGAPSLETWLGSLPALCADYPRAADLPRVERYTRDGACNWKAYCDNTVEGYHLPSVHKGLTQLVDRERTRIESYDGGRLVVFHVTYSGGRREAPDNRGLWFYRFPGFQGVVGRNGFRAERIEALAPQRMRYTAWHCFEEQGAAERQEAMAASRAVVAEDIGICESVQRNYAAGAFKHGYLSPGEERHTIRFQELVREALAR